MLYCPDCGGELKHRDYVKRKVKYSDGDTIWIKVERKICTNCKKIHRVLPDFVEPFKQYDKRIIHDVQHGRITPDTIGFEDYPCEMTMERWKRSRDKHGLL